jgi:hypothetical protein
MGLNKTGLQLLQTDHQKKESISSSDCSSSHFGLSALDGRYYQNVKNPHLEILAK